MQTQIEKTSAPPDRKSPRIWTAVFLLLFMTYAYCRQTPSNHNAVSRTALTAAVLEEGKLSIDKYQAATGDKAFCRGHFYSDKAPGLSLAALPSQAAAYGLLKLAGKGDMHFNPAVGEMNDSFKILTVVGTIFTSALSTAIAAVALGLLCRKLGCSLAGSVFASLAFGLATPAWGWATAFFGHALAGNCCLIGFTIAVSLLEFAPNPRRESACWILVGFLLAYGVLVEYTLAVATVIVGGMIILCMAKNRKRRIARTICDLSLGVVPVALIFFAYNYLAFGSFFQLSYGHVVGFTGMRSGFMGLTYPKLDAIYGIIASPYRGLLWISPLMAAVPFAFYSAWRFRPSRPYLLASSWIIVYFIALNASYHYWDGGYSTGPRHLTPSLGFACLPLGFCWTAATLKTRCVLAALLAASFFFSFVCATAGIDASPEYADPFWQKLLPDFLAGGVRNLGELLGMTGLPTLLPLLAIWLLCGAYVARQVLAVNRQESILIEIK